jgi:hypothetical protein
MSMAALRPVAVIPVRVYAMNGLMWKKPQRQRDVRRIALAVGDDR